MAQLMGRFFIFGRNFCYRVSIIFDESTNRSTISKMAVVFVFSEKKYIELHGRYYFLLIFVLQS